jgi:hypothetical protein
MWKIIRTIYYYFVKQLAKFLLKSLKPTKIPELGNVGVSSLVCHSHIIMFIYSLNSFYFHTKKILPCTVIDDGSLTLEDCSSLKKYFPGINIIVKHDADIRVRLKLRKYPAVLNFRKKETIHKFHLKVTDPILLPAYEKIIYIDSDVLFVGNPKRIVKWIDSSEKTYLYEPEYRSADWGIGDGWNFAGKAIQYALNISFDECFNSGLLCLHKKSYPLVFLNKVASYMQRVEMDKTWLAEQYSFAAVFSHLHAKKFGKKYKHLALPMSSVFESITEYACVHFAYLAKPYYYREVVKLLYRTKFFTKNIDL